jgi:hypothetical protein
MNYVILDLDNCIADDGWRIPRIRWDRKDPMERYHEYHSLAGFDTVANTDLFEFGDPAVIILTARPVLYRSITEEWLRRNRISYHHLIMRNNHDHRSSLDLKRHMLHWLPDMYGVPWKSIVAAYDDRDDIVEMYRKHHIDAHVRFAHRECAYTAPPMELAA